MNVKTVATTFLSRGVELVGIIEKADNCAARGVIVVVGGPQYRIGSHRQFVLLTRYLAENGIPTMRFDHQGVGDSDGDLVSFENIGPDIFSAIDCFFHNVPELTDVVIWGLCDAASAAMMYAHTDDRVTGLVLLNPWVRSEQSLASAYVDNYYSVRFRSKAFWVDLAKGRIAVVSAIVSYLRNTLLAFRLKNQDGDAELDLDGVVNEGSFIDAMRNGLGKFSGEVVIMLSGEDITAKEFSGLIARDERWAKIISNDRFFVRRVPMADHTFSSPESRQLVERQTRDWVCSSNQAYTK